MLVKAIFSIFNKQYSDGFIARIKLNDCRITFLFFLSFFCVDVNALDSKEDFSEARIKAAYVYNFLSFVEWPEGEVPSVLNVCVMDTNNKYRTAFNSMPSKTKSGLYLKVSYLESKSDLTELDSCHAVFFTKTNNINTRKILSKLETSPSLTFSESDKFIEQGGMINFLRISNKIRFEINVDAYEKAKLKISSKILRIAERLIKEDDHE